MSLAAPHVTVRVERRGPARPDTGQRRTSRGSTARVGIGGNRSRWGLVQEGDPSAEKGAVMRLQPAIVTMSFLLSAGVLAACGGTGDPPNRVGPATATVGPQAPPIDPSLGPRP